MNTRSRRIKIPLGRPDPAFPETEETIEIVLFYKDEKLKSHAVKHLTNLGESETAWKSLTLEERSVVTSTIKNLQDMGCPYFLMASSVPPCEFGVSSCRHYPRCGGVTAELERIYLRAVSDVIVQSAGKPRWARFFSDRDGNDSIVFMPDRPVVAKASLMEENVYNVITCYGAVSQSFQEMRDLQVEMIRNEARGRTITFYKEAAWGLSSDAENGVGERPAGEQDAIGKHPKRKAKTGRFRGGGAHWRRFLDEQE